MAFSLHDMSRSFEIEESLAAELRQTGVGGGSLFASIDCPPALQPPRRIRRVGTPLAPTTNRGLPPLSQLGAKRELSASTLAALSSHPRALPRSKSLAAFKSELPVDVQALTIHPEHTLSLKEQRYWGEAGALGAPAAPGPLPSIRELIDTPSSSSAQGPPSRQLPSSGRQAPGTLLPRQRLAHTLSSANLAEVRKRVALQPQISSRRQHVPSVSMGSLSLNSPAPLDSLFSSSSTIPKDTLFETSNSLGLDGLDDGLLGVNDSPISVGLSSVSSFDSLRDELLDSIELTRGHARQQSDPLQGDQARVHLSISLEIPRVTSFLGGPPARPLGFVPPAGLGPGADGSSVVNYFRRQVSQRVPRSVDPSIVRYYQLVITFLTHEWSDKSATPQMRCQRRREFISRYRPL